MAISRIRKNDTVIVVSGNDAGRTGTVLRVDPRKGVAVVGGINVHKKAMRRTEKNAGGLVDIELPIRLCKLMPYAPHLSDQIASQARSKQGNLLLVFTPSAAAQVPKKPLPEFLL